MKMHSILALLLFIPMAHATSFFIQPFSEFTKTTEVIVRGVTSNIRAENVSNANGEKSIYTFANLSLKEVIKGNLSGAMIRVRKPGGTVDDITLEIPSSVDFKEGEEGVFFLGPEQDDHTYEVVGMELGKFNLVKQNGAEVLKGGLFAYSKPRPHDRHSANTIQQGDTSENLKPWTIDQLKQLVQQQGGNVQNSAPNSEPKSETVSNTSAQTTSTEALANSNKTEQNTSVTNNFDASQQDSLYNDSAVWYVLALSLVSLGIYLFMRRG